MPMNINLNDKARTAIESVAQIADMQSLRSSKYPDTKNVFKHEAKEQAFLNRYGKKVATAITYEGKDGAQLRSFNDLLEYTIRYESPKRHHYAITEYLDGGNTKYVLFSYRHNGKNYENRFDRFLDAEVSLADKIAEEK